MSEPKVTVWLPTCNRLELLKRAIDSVLNQTYNNIELYVVDNGSNDETQSYMEELIIIHNRVRYHRFDTNRGACEARNYAIEHGTGEFATGIDDDDEFLPNRIKQLVDAYSSDYAFVCTGFLWDYGAVRKAVINSPMYITLDSQLNFNQASNQVLTKRSHLIDVGLFDSTLISSQDWDMWTRMIIKYGPAKRLKGASYIVHTSHDKPRITDKKENRLAGLWQFYRKYNHLMSEQNKRCFDFFILYNSNEKMSFRGMLRFLSRPIASKAFRYWVASSFPFLAKMRLTHLKNKD
ncbi:glycosyltransferase [Pseudoalteromonas tunicata]|uniref:glycosyltransferase n=1 Tax=Pseudoalteromonas tunicata TaxID=314281 RepID=UPI00273FD391|nr:glycosyltransferase [Pseudoalteromonas tunicata]MDP5211690.1 glycosyltransferase [Pseudoalteromonas tunicata]